MRRAVLKKPLSLDYESLFTKSWIRVLTPLLVTDYMFNLMAFLQEIYSLVPDNFIGQRFVYPFKNRLFSNFRNCPYESLRVVIIGKEPYADDKATGIPFSVSNPAHKTEELQAIDDCIAKNVYPNDEKEAEMFDDTLFSWTYQGVFLLDASSTREGGSAEMEHLVYWKNFTRQVINLISNDKKDIVFILMGKQNHEFEKYIDRDKHHVFLTSHPLDCIMKGEKYDSKVFNQTNQILERAYGEGNGIHW